MGFANNVKGIKLDHLSSKEIPWLCY